MHKKPDIWQPRYTITPAIARGLMEIEAAKTAVGHTTLPLASQEKLRQQARVRATHYSTRIEGNRLTLEQAREVIEGKKLRFHGRERDMGEVRNYWNAILRVEKWAEKKIPLTEDLVKRLHALVDRGIRAKATPYRGGQNVIRDAASGAIVYLPPEARDVPGLMAGLVAWTRRAEKEGLPVPLLAGLVHYQFVTIHPYLDGNGRTARLLATFLLHGGGYGLNGFLSLEEHHARDLGGYYRALAAHPHHNYYEGRADADLTGWLEYFVGTLVGVFQSVREQTEKLARKGTPAIPEGLRKLDARARTVLALFADNERITAGGVAKALGLSDRMARVLLHQWVGDGWLMVAQAANRTRSYSLSALYRQYIGKLSATK